MYVCICMYVCVFMGGWVGQGGVLYLILWSVPVIAGRHVQNRVGTWLCRAVGAETETPRHVKGFVTRPGEREG